MNKLYFLLVSIAFMTSCKKEKSVIDPEDGVRSKIENTHWVAYKGWTWSQQTQMVDLTPDQFIFIEAKVAHSDISLQYRDEKWSSFITDFIQVTSTTGEYQLSLPNAPYEYVEFYVNEDVSELRLYIKRDNTSSTTYMIFFKRGDGA